MIRSATTTDIPAICGIYNYYVLNSIATFEEAEVTAEEMQRRMQSIQTTHEWLVCEDEGVVLGYAYAGPWKSRAAYKHTAEVSVYVHTEHKRKGIGTALYAELLSKLRDRKIHCIIGGVAGDNALSHNLHEVFGFERVGTFKENGYKFDRWVDVTYWQLLL